VETIQGKTIRLLDAPALAQRLAGYQHVLIDLGTGDGRFAAHQARRDPGLFAIGVDACRENLRQVSRSAPENALFVIANALALPRELHGLAARVTINFPWGSLLEGLLTPDPALLDNLRAVMRLGAALEVRLNASALAEAGWALEAGGERVHALLSAEGFNLRPPQRLGSSDLRALPTTWAKRMAFGRRPEAVGVFS
jgi:16S rRNA (adenine(1408)-N(1))-methyltransferase